MKSPLDKYITAVDSTIKEKDAPKSRNWWVWDLFVFVLCLAFLLVIFLWR